MFKHIRHRMRMTSCINTLTLIYAGTDDGDLIDGCLDIYSSIKEKLKYIKKVDRKVYMVASDCADIILQIFRDECLLAEEEYSVPELTDFTKQIEAINADLREYLKDRDRKKTMRSLDSHLKEIMDKYGEGGTLDQSKFLDTSNAIRKA